MVPHVRNNRGLNRYLWTGVALVGLLAYGIERDREGLYYASASVVAIAVLIGAWQWKKWAAISTVVVYGVGGVGWFMAGGGPDALGAVVVAVLGAIVFAGRWRYFEPASERQTSGEDPRRSSPKARDDRTGQAMVSAGRACPRCGQAVSDTARFCERCGERLVAGVQP